MVLVCSKTTLYNGSAVGISFYSINTWRYYAAGTWNTEVSRLLSLSTLGILWRNHVRKHWVFPTTELFSISQDLSLFYLIITTQQDMECRQGEGRWGEKENTLYSDLGCRCSGNLFLIAMMGVMIVAPRLLIFLSMHRI